MSDLLHAIGQVLFPERIRRYLTFRLVTVFVTALFLANFALNALNEPEPYSDAALRIDKTVVLMHTPLYLLALSIFLVLSFWILYGTRKKTEYYWMRAVLYGILLSGIYREIGSFLLPVHHVWWNSR